MCGEATTTLPTITPFVSTLQPASPTAVVSNEPTISPNKQQLIEQMPTGISANDTVQPTDPTDKSNSPSIQTRPPTISNGASSSAPRSGFNYRVHPAALSLVVVLWQLI